MFGDGEHNIIITSRLFQKTQSVIANSGISRNLLYNKYTERVEYKKIVSFSKIRKIGTTSLRKIRTGIVTNQFPKLINFTYISNEDNIIKYFESKI